MYSQKRIKDPTAYLIRILKHPVYFFIFLGSSVITSMVLIWFFNLELIIHIINSSVLDVTATIGFFFESIGVVYAGLFDSVRNFLFVAFSLIFGLNVSVLIYTHRKIAARPLLRKSSFITALLGAGCVACGGSILAPVLTGIGLTASIGISLFINIVAFVLAICFGIYSLHILLRHGNGSF